MAKRTEKRPDLSKPPSVQVLPMNLRLGDAADGALVESALRVDGAKFCDASQSCTQLALRRENLIAVGMKIRERVAVRDHHHHHFRGRHVAVTRIALSPEAGFTGDNGGQSVRQAPLVHSRNDKEAPQPREAALSLPSQGRRRLQHVLARTLYGREASLVSRQVSLEASHKQTVILTHVWEAVPLFPRYGYRVVTWVG
jgi:hypothetical protein